MIHRWRWTILWLGIASFFVGAIAWMATDRRIAKDAFDELSIFNTSDQGLSLAYRYLQSRRGSAVTAALTRSLSLDEVPPSAVVFRVGGDESFAFRREEAEEREEDQDEDAKGEKRDATAEKKKGLGEKEQPPLRSRPFLISSDEEWVSAGGRLVIATKFPRNPLSTDTSTGGSFAKVFPLWPSVTRLEVPSPSVLTGRLPPGMHAVMLHGELPVIARSRIGKGEIILMSIPDIFSNQHLAKAHHLALLQELAQNRSVWFDESAHGLRTDAGLFEMMRRWNLGPFLFLLFVAFIAGFWRNARRIGPPENRFEDTRSEAMDLVDSLGQMYSRMLHNRDAITLYYESFVRAVKQQTHLRGRELDEKIRQLAPNLVPPSATRKMATADLKRILFTINEGFRRLYDAKRR